MFLAINIQPIRKIFSLHLIHVSDITQTTAHYWNVVRSHKWFVAA